MPPVLPPARVPTLGPGTRFVPVERLGGEPHVVVDGPRLPGTVLSLSHWPDADTPPHLAADTSAAIVDRYLSADPDGPPVTAVTNNHFDEDGLLGVWMLLERPGADDPRRALAVSAAEAGDFGTWTDAAAAQVALACMAMADPLRTPIPAVRAALGAAGGGDPAGALYLAILPHVGPLLADPERARALWDEEWRVVTDDLALIRSGTARIAEHRGADVAVVRAPRPLHDMAVHPQTLRTRVLTATPGGGLVLTHRYETWVRYVSRPLAPRVDLTPLLPRLDALETGAVTWRFEGVEPIRSRLWPADRSGRPSPSSLAPEELVDELEAFLRSTRVG